MRAATDHQNGNSGTSRFSRYEKWQDIPVEILREFADELRFRYTDRGVSKIVGVSATAVQDFVKARTQPERRTVRAFGELYLRSVPLAYERETVDDKSRVPPLKSVLPEGKDAALQFLERLRLANDEGSAAPLPEHVRAWLREIVEAEYQIEEANKEQERKRRPKGSGPAPRRPRRKRPDPDTQ